MRAVDYHPSAASRVWRLSAVVASMLCLVLSGLALAANARAADSSSPVASISGTAVRAVEEGKTTGTYELHVAAVDGSNSAPQSGVAKIEIGVNGSGQQSWENNCLGENCGLEVTWSYLPANYSSEFPRWLTVKVTDRAGNVTEYELSIEGLEQVPPEAAPSGADSTPPILEVTGSAVEAIDLGKTTGKFELRMFAQDGSPSAPQSGIGKLEVLVDGTAVQSWEKYCPKGSCRLKIQWTYSPEQYFPVKAHTVTVTARDRAGNVKSQTFELDKTPPKFAPSFFADAVTSNGNTTVTFNEAHDSASPLERAPSYMYRYSLNSAPFTSWTQIATNYFVIPTPHENEEIRIEVYAKDFAGNRSTTESAQLKAAPPAAYEPTAEEIAEAERDSELPGNPNESHAFLRAGKTGQTQASQAVTIGGGAIVPPERACAVHANDPHISTSQGRLGLIKIKASGFAWCGPGAGGSKLRLAVALFRESPYGGFYETYPPQEYKIVASPIAYKKAVRSTRPLDCTPGHYYTKAYLYPEGKPIDPEYEWIQHAAYHESDIVHINHC
jgi:hypothetical protein